MIISNSEKYTNPDSFRMRQRSVKLIGKMKNVLIGLILLVSLYSCKKDLTPLGHLPALSSSIIGEWEWTKSESPWTGEITTPDDVGYDEIKVFSNESTLQILRNNTLYAEYTYSVTYEDCTETKSKGMLHIIQGSHPTFSIENNILVLSEASVDGPISYHKRIK